MKPAVDPPAAAELQGLLRSLREAGADRYDGPGFRFIEALLERAESHGGTVAERLEARAAARLAAFQTSMQAARAEAEATLATLQAAEADPDGALAAAHAAGDHKRVLREASVALRRVRSADPAARFDRLARRARAEGIELPEEAADPARAGDRLAHALFRQAAEHARGTLTVARAADRLPENVGVYNPDALAARTLAAIEALSPAWLRATLAELDDLAALAQLANGRKR